MIQFDRLPMTIGVVGSRSYEDHWSRIDMRKHVYRFIRQTRPNTEIVSGGARGIDRYAQVAAKTLGRSYTPFEPDTNFPIPARYFIRNRLLVEYIYEKKGILVAFIDPCSHSGTRRTYEYAIKKHVGVVLFSFAQDASYKGVEYYGQIYER